MPASTQIQVGALSCGKFESRVETFVLCKPEATLFTRLPAVPRVITLPGLCRVIVVDDSESNSLRIDTDHILF